MHELFLTLLCILVAVATAYFHGGKWEPLKKTWAQMPWAANLETVQLQLIDSCRFIFSSMFRPNAKTTVDFRIHWHPKRTF